MPRLSRLLLLALALVAAAAARAQPLVSTAHDGALDASHLRYYVDRGDTLGQQPGLERLRGLAWQTPSRAAVNLGFIRDPVWFRLRLQNPTDIPQERYLQIANPMLDSIELSAYQDAHLIANSHMGDSLPFAIRPVQHRFFTQRLVIAPRATVEVLLRVESASPVQLPINLWRSDLLISNTEMHTLWLGIYYGSLLAMLLYNLSVYINYRQRTYLYYIAYLCGIGSFFACSNGLGFQYLWPDHPRLSPHVGLSSLAATALFASLFTRSFLSVAHTRPALDRWLALLCASCAVMSVAAQWTLPVWGLQFLIALVVVTALSGLLTGVVRWHDKHPSAMLFTAAWLTLGLGSLLLAGNKLGVLPRSALTEHLAQMGSMIQFMVLSLAMIQRLNGERRAKYAAQRNALNFERQAAQSRQQALEIQRRATAELEEKVAQRTRELRILNDKLQTLSSTDPLTGLKNRRFLMERYHAEFSRSKRDGTPISVIIIDVDHFKAVNDNHGHLLGDELLKLVAHHIGAEARRETDIVARQGGEEFAAVLINNSAVQALAIAERIRTSVAAARYRQGVLSLQCTVSVGVATMIPQPQSRAEELFKCADDALYQSKAAGRNRVSVHGQAAA